MPVIKSAKKKLRQDKKRTARNKKVRETLKKLIKDARKKPSVKKAAETARAADKAAKLHIIHKNKAARIKATLAKLLPKTASQSKKEAPKTKNKPATKKPLK